MNVKIFIRNHSPQILTAISALGFAATVVTAVKATPKAQQLLAEKRVEKGEPLTTIEKVKIAAPCYIPSALTGAATLICMFGSAGVGRRSLTSLSGSYALIADQYEKYKHRVKEVYGEDAHREIMQYVIAPREEIPITAVGGWRTIGFDFPKEKEKLLFFDTISEVFFESTYSEVLTALYHTNRNFAIGGDESVEEYYKFLG